MESSNYDSRRNRNRRAGGRPHGRDDVNRHNERVPDKNDRLSDKAVDRTGDGSSRDLLNRKRPDLLPRKSFAEIADRELSSVDRTYADFICPKCGQQITELSSAIADKASGNPMHFDCVLQSIQESEPLKQNERIVYVGQGRFAIAYFENPHDLRHFTINRVIEWEARDKKFEWREKIAGVYSQIH